ncbi:hypothetical protein GQ457_06G000160 [Hibiscus cannabinus]
MGLAAQVFGEDAVDGARDGSWESKRMMVALGCGGKGSLKSHFHSQSISRLRFAFLVSHFLIISRRGGKRKINSLLDLTKLMLWWDPCAFLSNSW